MALNYRLPRIAKLKSGESLRRLLKHTDNIRERHPRVSVFNRLTRG